MVMTANGLAKLAEELGELQQIVGKMLAYGAGEHPDGKGALIRRFEDESADVTAAMTFVAQQFGADGEHVRQRAAVKLARFQAWHDDATD